MRIITAKKGDWYPSVEMDIRALLISEIGKKFIDGDCNFKYDTEIHFIRRRRKT